MRNNRGVTLVALVITIIVLLILAGVSLAMLTGDSGILTNADKAKANTAVANAKSSIEMAYMDIKTEVYALETEKSSVQAVAMDTTKMIGIAKKYIDGEETLEAVTINDEEGAVAIEIKYPSDVYETKVVGGTEKNVTVGAKIIYNASPKEGDPRVRLVWNEQ